MNTKLIGIGCRILFRNLKPRWAEIPFFPRSILLKDFLLLNK